MQLTGELSVWGMATITSQKLLCLIPLTRSAVILVSGNSHTTRNLHAKNSLLRRSIRITFSCIEPFSLLIRIKVKMEVGFEAKITGILYHSTEVSAKSVHQPIRFQLVKYVLYNHETKLSPYVLGAGLGESSTVARTLSLSYPPRAPQSSRRAVLLIRLDYFEG